MPTPRAGYFLADGTKVPGTTTIVNRWKKADALIAWAWRMGTEGKDFRKVRDAAADAGTLAHELVDARIHGREPVLTGATVEAIGLATKGLEAFDRWSEIARLRIEATEMPLVSERYRFGGTPDAIGEVAGKPALLDWKSGGVYADHLYQLSAYALLLEECRGLKVEEVHLVRLGKEDGSFSHHFWPIDALADAREGFLLMRSLYDLDARVQRRVK